MSELLDKVEYVPRTSCPLSRPGEHHPLRLRASVADSLTGRTFDILECDACQLGLTSPYPTPETVRYLYEDRETFTNFDPIRGTAMDRVKDRFAVRDLRRITHRFHGRRFDSILDFGTGNGRFALAAARAFGPREVIAVDFDRDPPPALRQSPAVEYRSIEAFRSGTSLHDLIVLRHVLEHVHEPVEFLNLLRTRLQPDGLLYIEVPNLDSSLTRWFDSYPIAFGLPFHLFHHTSRSLAHIVRAAGLTTTVRPQGMPSMGTFAATVLGQERTLFHQLLGVALHPVQLMMDAVWGKPCLSAACTAEAGSRAEFRRA